MEQNFLKAPKIKTHSKVYTKLIRQFPQKKSGDGNILLDMKYKLEQPHIMESFRIRAGKSGLYKVLQIFSILVLILFCAFLYLVSKQIQYIAFMCLVVLVYGISLVTAESRIYKATKQLFAKNETYYIKIYRNGCMETEIMPLTDLQTLKTKKLCFEATEIFFLKISSKYSICIPKQFLKGEEIVELRRFFAQIMQCTDLRPRR